MTADTPWLSGFATPLVICRNCWEHIVLRDGEWVHAESQHERCDVVRRQPEKSEVGGETQ